MELMLLTQLHSSRWRNHYDVTDATIMSICKANVKQPTQGVEGVQEYTKQETAQGAPTNVRHVEERIGSLINSAGYGKSRRNSWTEGCRGRGRGMSRSGSRSGGGSGGGSRGRSGSRGRRRGGGRLGFFEVFLFFPFFPKTRRGSGGALGDGVTRVQVVTGYTRETRLPMNWIKGQNRDSGLAYGIFAKSL